jgi:ketosteroid isomerase-like protein
MNTQEIAHDLVALCQQGKFDEAGEKVLGRRRRQRRGDGARGREPRQASRAGKGEWWAGAHDVHGVEVEGPYVNGDDFAVRFVMDITVKESGQRNTMDEVAFYRLKDGKIAEERFFYSM